MKKLQLGGVRETRCLGLTVSVADWSGLVLRVGSAQGSLGPQLKNNFSTY